MLIEKLPLLVTQEAIIEALRSNAVEQPGITETTADSYALGYLAAYVAATNQARIAADGADVRPLTDDEVDELLVNVSVAKLEKLLAERRADQDSPEPSDHQWRECAFPGCTRTYWPADDLFCEDHQDHECSNCGDEFLTRDHLLEHWRETPCGEYIGND